MFNSVKNGHNTHFSRHKHDRETPLTLYIALKIHATTRKRTLVDAFSSLGMCVTYDRLLQLTSDIGMASVSDLCQMVLCVHQRCAMGFSLLQQ